MLCPLKDLKPDAKALFNVMARVIFISLPGSTQRGDSIIKMELGDGTTDAPVKTTIIGQTNVQAVKEAHINDIVKIRNLRCTLYAGEVTLIVNEKDPFRITILDESDAARSLPEADCPEVCGFDQCSSMQSGTATLLVRIDQVQEDSAKRNQFLTKALLIDHHSIKKLPHPNCCSHINEGLPNRSNNPITEDSLSVTDYEGTCGTVHVGQDVISPSLKKGKMVCIHRASIWKGRPTLWTSCGVEEITEAEFAATASHKEEAQTVKEEDKEQKETDEHAKDLQT